MRVVGVQVSTSASVHAVLSQSGLTSAPRRRHRPLRSLPNSDSLHADLTSVGYKYQSDGRLLLEAKEDMRKRGMPSPDEGDAVALCFTEPDGSPYIRFTGFNRQIEYPGGGYI